jgi:4a-hydroxytetrahydrobiopterin dehydratase
LTDREEKSLALLAADVIEMKVKPLRGWQVVGAALAKEYRFADFKQAMAFVNMVALVADAAGHHPDIDIRYSKVYVSSSSHDAGGITQRDINLAAAIDQIR